MENRINTLEEKLRTAEQLQKKTPSPAVWGNIEKSLENSSKKPVFFMQTRQALRIAATLTVLIGVSAILIFTLDRNNQNQSWTACSDCVETLRDQVLIANLPISVSTRSLYQPFFRMSNGPEIYSATERLAATNKQNAMGAEEIMQAYTSVKPEHSSVQLSDFAGKWQIQGDRKQAFKDNFSASRDGKLSWKRVDSNGETLFSGESTQALDTRFVMVIEHDNRIVELDAFFENDNLVLDLTAFNSRYFRWQLNPGESMLFTSILPMQSYTAQATAKVVRFAEQNAVLTK